MRIVGALTFIKADQHIPQRSLIVGNPGKVVKQVSDEMIHWKSEGTKIYQQLANDMHHLWKPCEPLREIHNHVNDQETDYKTWDEMKENL